MELINELQNKYNIEYDDKNNILVIKDKIEVKDFTTIRGILGNYKIKTEIQVIGEKNDRKRVV